MEDVKRGDARLYWFITPNKSFSKWYSSKGTAMRAAKGLSKRIKDKVILAEQLEEVV